MLTQPVVDNVPDARNAPLINRKKLRALTWTALTVWLFYSFAMLGWYLMNDPEIFNAICRTRP